MLRKSILNIINRKEGRTNEQILTIMKIAKILKNSQSNSQLGTDLINILDTTTNNYKITDNSNNM